MPLSAPSCTHPKKETPPRPCHAMSGRALRNERTEYRAGPSSGRRRHWWERFYPGSPPDSPPQGEWTGHGQMLETSLCPCPSGCGPRGLGSLDLKPADARLTSFPVYVKHRARDPRLPFVCPADIGNDQSGPPPGELQTPDRMSPSGGLNCSPGRGFPPAPAARGEKSG